MIITNVCTFAFSERTKIRVYSHGRRSIREIKHNIQTLHSEVGMLHASVRSRVTGSISPGTVGKIFPRVPAGRKLYRTAHRPFGKYRTATVNPGPCKREFWTFKSENVNSFNLHFDRSQTRRTTQTRLKCH